MRVFLTPILAIGVAFAGACQEEAPPAQPGSVESSPLGLPTPTSFAKAHPNFDSYWYQGRAELTRYALSQARYGEVHDGEAVLIFVTEDFLPKVQVKYEGAPRPGTVSVLKLNSYRRFYTGIYPYTIMTSSFTPVRPPGAPTLKVSNSTQEWCGQAYTQINRRGTGLQAIVHSYFQGEADQTLTLPDGLLEDGLWAQIRIDPSAIPVGDQQIVPALQYIRFHHKALRAYPATIEKKFGVTNDLFDRPADVLVISYPPLARTLSIYYEPEFPRAIVGWVETNGPYETSARRTQAIIDDYWNHNGADDAPYRSALGLSL